MNNFYNYMKDIFQDDYEKYIESLDKPLYKGLSINTYKVDKNYFINNFKYDLKETKFDNDNYYIDSNLRLGNTIEHILGLFYLQEPSASSAVNLLNPLKDSVVIDLCAAPGGKTFQLSKAVGDKGLVVANEIDYKRYLKLLSNIERLGLSNVIATNSPVNKLLDSFSGIFDYVLVDAVCSGEGMIKKHDIALSSWNINNAKSLHIKQLEILDVAYKLAKTNGLILYSTCTYNTIENEDTIIAFNNKYPDIKQIRSNKYNINAKKDVIATRITYKDQGEGHFICLMQKNNETKENYKLLKTNINKVAIDFIKDNLFDNNLNYYQIDNRLYASKNKLYEININNINYCVKCGTIEKGRFEPFLQLYTSTIFKDLYKQTYDLKKDELIKYLKGELLYIKGYKGYVALTYNNYQVGFGKGDNNCIKNKYPKGKRIVGEIL